MTKAIIGVEQFPRVQFTIELAEGETMPSLITLPDTSLIVYAGKYASPGERYMYKRVQSHMIFSGPVREWKEHIGLEG